MLDIFLSRIEDFFCKSKAKQKTNKHNYQSSSK